MSHDLLAELAAYRNELVRVAAARSGQVHDQIDRVSAEVRRVVAELESSAAAYDENGQDVLAAHARVEARRLSEAVGSRRSVKGGRKLGRENVSDSTPLEIAGE